MSPQQPVEAEEEVLELAQGCFAVHGRPGGLFVGGVGPGWLQDERGGARICAGRLGISGGRTISGYLSWARGLRTAPVSGPSGERAPGL